MFVPWKPPITGYMLYIYMFNSIYVVILYVYDFVNANYIFCVYMCDEYALYNIYIYI